MLLRTYINGINNNKFIYVKLNNKVKNLKDAMLLMHFKCVNNANQFFFELRR